MIRDPATAIAGAVVSAFFWFLLFAGIIGAFNAILVEPASAWVWAGAVYCALDAGAAGGLVFLYGGKDRFRTTRLYQVAMWPFGGALVAALLVWLGWRRA